LSTNKHIVFDGSSAGLLLLLSSSTRLSLEWGRGDKDKMRQEKGREAVVLLDSTWEDQQGEMDHGERGRSLSIYKQLRSSDLEMVMSVYEHKPEHFLLRSSPPPS
jgi:hypothetical protein